jgi:hypothetical protein
MPWTSGATTTVGHSRTADPANQATAHPHTASVRWSWTWEVASLSAPSMRRRKCTRAQVQARAQALVQTQSQRATVPPLTRARLPHGAVTCAMRVLSTRFASVAL